MLSITQIIANLFLDSSWLARFDCSIAASVSPLQQTLHLSTYWAILGISWASSPEIPYIGTFDSTQHTRLKKWGAGSNRDSSTATVTEPPWRSASTVGCRAASVASAQGPCVAPPIKHQHKMMVIHGDTMAMRKVHKNASYSKTM